MTPRRTLPGRAAGFTLLELLVGMTVLSFIVLTVYSGLRLGSRSFDAGAERTELSSQLRSVESLLRRRIAKAYVPPATAAEAPIVFEGEPERLRFVTEMPAHLGGGGLYEVEVAVEPGERGRDLTFSRRLFHPDILERDDRDDWERVILVEDLEEAELAYFGARSLNATPDWMSRWRDLPGLPTLVRLRLRSEALGQWPELLVRVNADTSRSGGTSPTAGIRRTVPGTASPTQRPSAIRRP